MTDLHTRFRSLDSLSAPDLWNDIEERAMAMQPTRRSPWVLIAVTLLLVLAIGGAALVGSGIVKLPISVDASASPSSANPSSSAQASTSASSSPVVPVPASWTGTGNMIEARTSYTATRLLNGSVLVTGGVGTAISESGANILASAELYDPSTGQWTVTGAMLGIRNGHTATLLPDGRVLVAGGSACSDFDGCPLASAEVYDPDSGTWTATAAMLEARSGGQTATLVANGKVLVAGGNSFESGALATAEQYDPDAGTWSAAGGMAEARSGHTATLLLDGKVLVAGSGDPLTSAELYDPSSDSWTATGAMLEGRILHTATRLSDGRVLVAGSMNGTGASASAELYNPATGEWTATGSMLGGLVYHTATLLPGGMVLVAGGSSSVIDSPASAEAELYDPATGSWTATAGMLEAHGGPATLLGDGTVLVAGGLDASFSPLASAERYDPGSGN